MHSLSYTPAAVAKRDKRQERAIKLAQLETGGEQPLVAVAYDDDGKPLYWGVIVSATGGYFEIRRADIGEIAEHPMELTRIETESRQ